MVIEEELERKECSGRERGDRHKANKGEDAVATANKYLENIFDRQIKESLDRKECGERCVVLLHTGRRGYVGVGNGQRKRIS
jgi:RNA-splicing ligase RtcB